MGRVSCNFFSLSLFVFSTLTTLMASGMVKSNSKEYSPTMLSLIRLISTSVAAGVWVVFTFIPFRLMFLALGGSGNAMPVRGVSRRMVAVMDTRASPSLVTEIRRSTLEAALSAEAGRTSTPAIRMQTINTENIRRNSSPPKKYSSYRSILSCFSGKSKTVPTGFKEPVLRRTSGKQFPVQEKLKEFREDNCL